MNRTGAGFLLMVILAVIGNLRATSQITMPEVLDKGTLTEQMNYLQDRTRIYENYRAIREDMFQKIKKNSLDSLKKAKNEITGYIGLTAGLNNRIDSLNTSLETTKEELDEMTRTKNNVGFFGMQINKITYNLILWTIIVGLAFLLVVGFLSFKRNLSVTRNTKKELKELKEEFEAYRQKTRLEREKMSMDHFNELKKLRGG